MIGDIRNHGKTRAAEDEFFNLARDSRDTHYVVCARGDRMMSIVLRLRRAGVTVIEQAKCPPDQLYLIDAEPELK